MVRFLSPPWFAEQAARAAPPDDVELTIQQRVRAGPDGDVLYLVRVAGGRAYVELGTSDNADVLLTEDYETALAIHEGRLSAADALAAGRIKVGGALNRLLTHGAAMEGTA